MEGSLSPADSTPPPTSSLTTRRSSAPTVAIHQQRPPKGSGNKKTPDLAGRHLPEAVYLKYEIQNAIYSNRDVRDAFGSSRESVASVVQRPRVKSGIRFPSSRPTKSHIHTNFRFVTMGEVPSDPDEPLAWSDVAMALVPSPTPVLCPICLDTPTLPRVTRCGHVYCLLCLLRFAALGQDPKGPKSPQQGKSVWRCCPICFEDFRVNEVRPARVIEQTDWRETGGWLPFVLRRVPGQAKPLVDRWKELSPFERLTRVTPGFLERELQEREECEMAVLLSEATPFDLDLLQAHLNTNKSDSSPEVRAEYHPQPASPSPTVYFHQAADGQYLFLHPLSIKMMKSHFGAYSQFPTELTLRVVEVESLVMGEAERRRYKQLAHLPLGTPFGLCEVDLSDILPPAVIAQHRAELDQRARNREQRNRLDDERREAFFREESTRMRMEAQDLAPTLSSYLNEQPLRDYSQDYINFPAISDDPANSATEPIPIKPTATSTEERYSFADAAGTPPLLAGPSNGKRGRGKTIALFGTSQRSIR